MHVTTKYIETFYVHDKMKKVTCLTRRQFDDIFDILPNDVRNFVWKLVIQALWIACWQSIDSFVLQYKESLTEWGNYLTLDYELEFISNLLLFP